MIQFITSVRNYIHTRQRWLYPLVIVLTAMIANGVSMFFEDGICNDAVKYHTMIANWIKNDDIYLSTGDSWLATTIPPFFLWMVKVLTEFLNVEIFTAARILNFICGAFTPLFFYYLVNCFAEKKNFALFCALTLACHPAVVYISTIHTRDCLCFFLTVVTLFFAVHGTLHDRTWKNIVAGVSFSAAAFTRYEAWELFPCMLLFLICCCLGKKISWCKGVACFAMFTAGAVVGALLLAVMMGFHATYIEQVLLRYAERFQGFM